MQFFLATVGIFSLLAFGVNKNYQDSTITAEFQKLLKQFEESRTYSDFKKVVTRFNGSDGAVATSLEATFNSAFTRKPCVYLKALTQTPDKDSETYSFFKVSFTMRFEDNCEACKTYLEKNPCWRIKVDVIKKVCSCE